VRSSIERVLFPEPGIPAIPTNICFSIFSLSNAMILALTTAVTYSDSLYVYISKRWERV